VAGGGLLEELVRRPAWVVGPRAEGARRHHGREGAGDRHHVEPAHRGQPLDLRGPVTGAGVVQQRALHGGRISQRARQHDGAVERVLVEQERLCAGEVLALPAQLGRDVAKGGVEPFNKQELVELAASIGIENRTSMTKDELVDAIAKATR